jgi:2-polyprenyl-6-hydroxyphenyl methylase/3-demethylubiquinone-9 3-methyltransferase
MNGIERLFRGGNVTKRVENYGWNSDQGPHSCGYLSPVVLAWLEKLQPGKVLDLGAGNGALCRTMVEAGYEVVGVEPDADGVEIARRQCPQAQFYRLGVDDSPDAVTRDHPDGFDIVVSTEVVEHLYAPRRLPAFAHAVLRRGGHLLVTTPYHGYLKNLAISLAGGWDRHADPLWDGGHIKLFSRRTITRLLNEAGFNLVSFGGVGRVPYLWKSMVVVAVKE